MGDKQQWILSQIASYPKETPSYEIASDLNFERLIDNPVEQGQVPKPINVDAISALIPATERFEIQETNTYKHLLDAIAKNNIEWVTAQIENLVASGKMSQQTLALIVPTLSETIPDPNWQPQILASKAHEAGYEIVYTHEIEELR